MDSKKVFDTKELQARVISGLVFAGVFLFVILEGGLVFVLAVTALVALASLEIYQLLEMKGESPYKFLGILLSSAIPIISYIAPYDFVFAILSFSLIAIFFIQVVSREFKGAIEKVLMTYFGIIYTGWLGGAHSIMMRNIEEHVDVVENFARIDAGAFLFMFVVASTVSADIGAYFAGKRFGRIKIAEKISPGKTLEGFLGGLGLSILVAILMKIIFNPQGTLFTYIFLGALCAFVGLIGDISESALKRDVHVKDSGFLIPGHGGVLDRLDSLIFSIPVLYYVCKYMLF
ncbi:MAG: phosphatidate cytidylyltransferase [Candidatus Calescibacterium sp.]|nr:phosphatidate cytidylyltransferase [Candidatus Calescibacterium sp.]MCX7734937.1 phosphatidate cytidylyltransferase [bacterium]MDW8087992.1 phosphatidate cytidylyltransferase [Candidatus Calescibacterium sp.]